MVPPSAGCTHAPDWHVGAALHGVASPHGIPSGGVTARQLPEKHTCASVQLIEPHGVQSGASSMPQPDSGSQVATWQASVGRGQAAVVLTWTQPCAGSHASWVQMFWSSQLRV